MTSPQARQLHHKPTSPSITSQAHQSHHKPGTSRHRIVVPNRVGLCLGSSPPRPSRLGWATVTKMGTSRRLRPRQQAPMFSIRRSSQTETAILKHKQRRLRPRQQAHQGDAEDSRRIKEMFATKTAGASRRRRRQQAHQGDVCDQDSRRIQETPTRYHGLGRVAVSGEETTTPFSTHTTAIRTRQTRYGHNRQDIVTTDKTLSRQTRYGHAGA